MCLLAKLIILKDSEASAKITFEDGILKPYDLTGKRRWGRPRLDWLKVTLEDFWLKAKSTYEEAKYWGDLDINNLQHRELLEKLAQTFNEAHHFE